MTQKEELYRELLISVRSLSGRETDLTARMANIASAVHSAFPFLWTGFYSVCGEELVLGPFQGPIACTRIPYGKGVCGTAWKEGKSIVVPDVEQFPGHIACSSESKSEIVVPVRDGDEIKGVLDIDSREPGTFDGTDLRYLELIAGLVYGTQCEIYFAAGCFWGAQKFFKKVKGVVSTEVGFVNGRTVNPTYSEVYTDTTGFAECVRLTYDPRMISLTDLTQLYFSMIDPTSLNRQGEDSGTRYRTGVYYASKADLPALETVFSEKKRTYGDGLMVELLPIENYYSAEEYHQDYLDKNPEGYCHLPLSAFSLASSFAKLPIIEKHYTLLSTDELYRILQIRGEVFTVGQKCIYQDMDGCDRTAFHLWTEENGKACSYLRVFIREDGCATIGRVAVLEKYRGKGEGARIVMEGIRAAKAHFPGRRIAIHAQCYTIGFYEKLGFRVTSGEFMEADIPHVGMEYDG